MWDDIRDELFSEEEENNCIAGSIPSIDAENKGKRQKIERTELSPGFIVSEELLRPLSWFYNDENRN